MTRLMERESCNLRNGYKEGEIRKTQQKIVEDRKKEMHEKNMKTFGKVSIGVHGKELPKFGEDDAKKEWWKLRKGYNSNPHHRSAAQMSQDNKHWAPNDMMFLSDYQWSPGPKDGFKISYTAK